MSTPRHISTRSRDDDRWRCHGCGAKHGLEVIRNEADEDDYKLRIRRCKHCGELMATEESPISLDQFYARNVTAQKRERRYLARIARRKTRRVDCSYCPGHYQMGSFSKHIQSAEHLAALKTVRTPQRREIERKAGIRKYWRARGFDLETATATHALRDARPTLIGEEVA